MFGLPMDKGIFLLQNIIFLQNNQDKEFFQVSYGQ